MKIKQIEKILLESGIEQNEAIVEAKMLVKHFLNLSDKDLILNDEFETSELLLEKVNLRAKTKQPVQYIIGLAYFMGEYFLVNENVLIPRDETELLVRKASEIIKSKKYNQILDVGTGSGCIACMLAKLNSVQVLGVDISLDALQVAINNATTLNLFNKAIFRKSDIFSNLKPGEKFDMIASNPPYIPQKERVTIQKEVTFEPDLALYAQDEHGLDFYKKIIQSAQEYLNEGGCLIFEAGINQAEQIVELMKQQGFSSVGLQKDLAGIERVVWGFC